MHIRGLAALTAGLALALAVAVPGGPAWSAPAANPELLSRAYRGDDAEPGPDLRIADLDIKVDILGGVARTVITARFDNPTDRDLEGELILDLPARSVVTGYALDIDDRMIDGVLVSERKARVEYEARVRDEIDPGIATVTREGDFKTRVYPVRAREGRVVRVEFVTALEPGVPYVLPLRSGKPVDRLSIAVTVADAAAPVILGPGGLTVRPGEPVVAEKVALSGALSIGPVERTRPMVVSRHRAGERFFDIDDAVRPVTGGLPVSRARIYWDRSLSRGDDDLEAEIALLDGWLARTKPPAVDLVLFDAARPEVVGFAGPGAAEALKAKLRSVRYGGGNAMTGLFRLKLDEADACLLFSDGVVTVDAYRPEPAGCPLFTVSSAPGADRGFLKALAIRSGGEHLDLTAAPPAALVERLTREAPRVVGVTTTSGKPIDYTLLPSPAGRIRVVGLLPARSDDVVVRLASAGERTRGYSAPAAAPPAHDGAGALWAHDRLGALQATDRPDPDTTLAFARRYGVASPLAAFIVMEEVGDYIEARIEPPASLGPAALAEYREGVDDLAGREKAARAERIEEVLQIWAEQKDWWRERYDYRADTARDGVDDAAAAFATPPPPPPVMAGEAPAQVRDGPVSAMPIPARRARDDDAGADVSEMVVTAQRSEPTISIEIEAWNPDRPYLVALKAASPGDWNAVYDAQRREHGALPAFYLDVAELLFRTGRKEEARAMALAALELPASGAGTMSIVADRMARYGDDDRAVWLREKVLFLEPDRPQPRRDLALALIDRAERAGSSAAQAKADYERAIALLTEVILSPASREFDGIELVALMDVNRAIARARDLGVTDIPLDRRLIALLDVDVRVTMEWDTYDTDMDLWVNEPTGERSYYGNQLTEIGGQLSNDMTDGYGPEQYLLRRAVEGEYGLVADVYSGNQLNPNGPVTIRVRIWRDWGRRNERMETLEVELKQDDDGERLLGKITVAPAGRK